MKEKLNQQQRLFAAGTYILIFVLLAFTLNNTKVNLLDISKEISIWFYSGVLLLVLGKYLSEPFFSAPSDTLTNSISLFLVLIGIKEKNTFTFYKALVVFSFFLFALSLLAILFKGKNNKLKTITFFICKKVGSAVFVFSLVFIICSWSFFSKTNLPMFVASIAIWICIVFFDVVAKLINFICDVVSLLKSKPADTYIGTICKYNNKNQFNIELKEGFYLDVKQDDIFLALTGKNEVKLLKCFATKRNDNFEILMCITINNESYLKDDFKDSKCSNFAFSSVGTCYRVSANDLPEKVLTKISDSKVVSSFNNFVGFVMPDSNIDTLKISILGNIEIKEGNIVEAKINNKPVMYQVINGITYDEYNTNTNEFGYNYAVARKLGTYDYKESKLNIEKWMPNNNELVYKCEIENIENEKTLQKVADEAIGRLPETNMMIPIKDINSLVTHNTAVLGILGVGKSCLTFELIKKIVNEGIKVVCIDITNQYASENGLYKYIDKDKIKEDFNEVCITKLEETYKKTGADNQPSSWGNRDKYEATVTYSIHRFLKSDYSVMIYNIEKHKVSKPASQYRISELTDLSLVEKTQIISQSLLRVLKTKGQYDKAHCCLVFEEAHSLIPEWNSVSEDGEKTASNGTAKVILQGRKYGLGCIAVTQRTANISKSILNQCNTIFAMRVFDDTGKAFLENYLGKDYTNTLPQLEERHAIVVGKGLELKQPVIIQLNDKKYVENKDNSSGIEVDIGELLENINDESCQGTINIEEVRE